MSFRGWEKQKINLADGSQTEAICPIIISASRATDIPAFFAKWLHNRLQAGYMRWINPFNTNQVQYISFSQTRLIIFWSKNPEPLIQYLPEFDIRGIHYYFQFTINDYQKEGLEPNIPPLTQRIATFKSLSEKLGKKHVIWRYDPLILVGSLTIDNLIDRISRVAEMLQDFTEKLVISFADISLYKKVYNKLARKNIDYREFTPELMLEVAERLHKLNREWGFKITTCAENIDLEAYGIEHNRCVDDNLMVKLYRNDNMLMDFLGYEPDLFGDSSWIYLKDKGQRKDCGCIVSKDIGMYDTCHHLCAYCYANTSSKVVERNLSKHDPESEALVT